VKIGGSLSIWFFIGLSLLVNGALIFVTGIYELVAPPGNKVVLYDLHANVWWGALLLALGVVYCVRFSPSHEKRPSSGG
jgi:FtsH-binding integral membrane protein